MRLTVRACVAMKGYFKLRVCLFKTWALSQRTSFSFLDLGKKKRKVIFILLSPLLVLPQPDVREWPESWSRTPGRGTTVSWRHHGPDPSLLLR